MVTYLKLKLFVLSYFILATVPPAIKIRFLFIVNVYILYVSHFSIVTLIFVNEIIIIHMT
jgi:hypothetical protein